jgi:hypothetical protein
MASSFCSLIGAPARRFGGPFAMPLRHLAL